LANNVAAMIDELLCAPTQDRANPNLNAGQSSQGIVSANFGLVNAVPH